MITQIFTNEKSFNFVISEDPTKNYDMKFQTLRKILFSNLSATELQNVIICIEQENIICLINNVNNESKNILTYIFNEINFIKIRKNDDINKKISNMFYFQGLIVDV
jgi:hypothetical protein